jgi:signal transduction histidine kinase
MLHRSEDSDETVRDATMVVKPPALRTAAALYVISWVLVISISALAIATSGLGPLLALRNAVVFHVPDVLLGLLLLCSARLLPWPQRVDRRFVFAHVALMLAYILASNLLWYGAVRLDQLVSGSRYSGPLLRLVPWRMVNNLLVYGTCCAFAYAHQHALRSRALAARVAEVETLRARAELEALRSQLNPHFILNTLHALLALVRRDPALAEHALEQLGDLLRRSLRVQRDGRDLVPLREEFALVSNYLELERLRLGERLHTEFDLRNEALDCAVPSFALQTLVENAIRHAIARRASGGTLAVRAHTVPGRVHLEVSDYGTGAPGYDADTPTGMGLTLLRSRLEALYAGSAVLDVAMTESGSRVSLELPLRASERAQ